MDDILGLLVVGFILMIPGAVVGFIVLLTPLDRYAKDSWRARILIIGVVGYVMWLVIVLGFIRLSIAVEVSFACIGFSDTFDANTPGRPVCGDLELYREAVSTELMYRYLVPSFIASGCYSNVPEVCAETDRFLSERSSDVNWLVNWLIGLPSFFGVGFVIWYFTRPHQQIEEEVAPYTGGYEYDSA